jgi:hypothetical protein
MDRARNDSLQWIDDPYIPDHLTRIQVVLAVPEK